MKVSNIVYICCFIAVFANSQILAQTTILTENFESSWQVPANLNWGDGGATGNFQWHREDYVTGWSGSTGYYLPLGAKNTSHSARFHSTDANAGHSGSLITPTMDFSSFPGNKRLVFHYINTSGTDSVQIYLSTDGGISYGGRIGVIKRSSYWTEFSFNLGTTTSANVKIKITATSDKTASDIGIDELSVIASGSAISGTKTIPGDFASITDAIDAVHKSGVSAPIVFELQTGYNPSAETVFPLSFSSLPGVSAINTLTIRPASSVAVSITSSTTDVILYLNNASYITLDGRQGGTGSGKYLTIENTNSGGRTILLENASTYNTIRNCVCKGAYYNTSITNQPVGGTINFGNSNWTYGNSYNTVTFCDVRNAANDNTTNIPMIGIYSNGSMGSGIQANSYNTLSNNNIFNFKHPGVGSSAVYSAGIFLEQSTTGTIAGNYAWTISGNSIYQPAAQIYTTAGTSQYGIAIGVGNGAGDGFVVSGNYIGGTEPLCAGSQWTDSSASVQILFSGIYMYNASGVTCSVQGNTVKNIKWVNGGGSNNLEPGNWCGIFSKVGNIDVGSSVGNVVGSADGSGPITLSVATGASSFGIGTTASGATQVFANNLVGSFNISSTGGAIHNFNAISTGQTLVSWTVQNNTVTNISGASATAATFIGIRQNNSSGGYSILNNTINNMSMATGFISGIQSSGGTATTISGNTINRLTASASPATTASSPSVRGIFCQSSTAALIISANTVDGLFCNESSNSVTIGGVVVNATSGTGTVSKNFINTLVLGSYNASSAIYGIYSGVATNFNAVYSNNIARLGIDSSANNKGNALYGLYDANGATSNTSYYFNSVYIGGSVSGTTQHTYGFNSAASLASTILRTVQNNIFYNARTGGTTGNHYAVKMPGTSINPLYLSANYNIYACGTPVSITFNGSFNGTDYTSFFGWQTAFGQDMNSAIANPKFIAPDSLGTNLNMHIASNSPTPVEGNGLAISGITDDYYGNDRESNTPTDIGANAGNFQNLDIIPPVIVFAALSNSSSTTSRVVGAVTITDASGVNTTAGLKPRLYFKRSTDAEQINTNSSGTDGWKYVEANGTSSPFDFTVDYSLLFGPVNVGTIIQYFVVAQDNSIPSVGVSSGTFAITPASVALTTATLPVGRNGSYTVVNGYSGSVFVGSSQSIQSLTKTDGLFSKLNTGVLSGNLTVLITSDLSEDGANALNTIAEEGVGNYTITIAPDAAALRTISGADLSAGLALINFNGIDRLTIDGRYSGAGKYLLFRTTNTTAASCGAAIQFSNAATSCSLRYCYIESNSTTSTRGNILLDNTGANDVVIDHNDIRSTTGGTINMAACGLYSNYALNKLSITDNSLYNFTSYGCYLQNIASNAVITGNSVYLEPGQTAPNTTTFYGIRIGGASSSGHTVSDNYVGGRAPQCGGSAYQLGTGSTFYGIYGSFGTAVQNSFQNNTIQNIQINTGSGSFYGLYFTSAGNVRVGTVIGNTIGHPTISGSITSQGTGLMTGISLATSSFTSVRNNLVANLVISTTSANTAVVKGIDYAPSVSAAGLYSDISNNNVHDLSATSSQTNVTNGCAISGIVASLGANVYGMALTLEGNEIYNLTNSPNNTNICAVQGLYLAGMKGDVRRNKIYNLMNNSSNPSSAVFGIQTFSTWSYNGWWNINNNFISIGNGSTSAVKITGIADLSASPSIVNYYYNTVHIGGSATMLGKAATVATYGFSRGNTNSPSSIVLRNNIFDISRTGGSGSHIAVANISSTYANWNAGTSNYNILNVPNASEVAQHIGSGSLLSFSSWKDSSGCDANSIADHAVSFVNSSSDLHLAGSSRGDKQLTGTPLSGYTTDVDGDVRHSLYPYIGADEVTTSPLALQLTLTALPEGFYDGTSLIPDTLNIQLCKGTTPYNVIDSIQVLPNDAGISSSYFRGNSKSDSSYYIVIKHRNSIETWSGTPALFTNGIAIFNITTSASQAYGNNLVLKAGRYCIYSGDVNQDGIVDFSDLVAIDNDQFTFVGGYVVTDITGDQFVDFSDLSLCDNNQFNFISVAKPGLKRVQKPAHSRISSQQIY